MGDLLPCFWCGKATSLGYDAMQEAIMCFDCMCAGPERCSEAEAIAAWNRRAPTALAAIPEVAALLREARAQGMDEALKAVNKARETVIHSANRNFIDGVAFGHDRSESAIRTAAAAPDLARSLIATHAELTKMETRAKEAEDRNAEWADRTEAAERLAADRLDHIVAAEAQLAEAQKREATETARADAAEALVKGLRAGLLSVCEYEPDERDNPLVVIMRMARLARAALGGWMPPDGSVMVPIPIRLAKEFRDRVADEMAAWPDDTAYQDDLRAFASALDAALLPPAPEGEAQREEARKG